MLSNTTHDHARTKVGPSRRTVLRSAARAVPAVSVATAAPAFAASGPAKVTISSMSARWGRYDAGRVGTPLTYSITLTNTGGTASGPVTVTTSVPSGSGNFYYYSIWTAPGGGWTAVRNNGQNITLTAPGLAPGTSSSATLEMNMWDGLAWGNSLNDALTRTANSTASDGAGGTTTHSTSFTLVRA